MPRYRYRQGPHKGRWRDTRLQAEEDAISKGLASRNEWADQNGVRQFYGEPGLEIEEKP